MRRPVRRTLLVALACALLWLMAACSAQRPPLISDAKARIGVAPFSQPASTADLLAGYVSDTAPRLDAKVFPQLDNDFADLLAELTSRDYTGLDVSRECMQKRPRRTASPAFDHWLLIGKCMNVDILIVPQIHLWQDRQDGNPAAVTVDIFLLDIKNRALLSRSRYDEKQRALLENLLDVGKFIERGGRWVSASTLAKEGMFKAIKDFGL